MTFATVSSVSPWRNEAWARDWQRQERESNEQNEVSAARPTRLGVETDE